MPASFQINCTAKETLNMTSRILPVSMALVLAPVIFAQDAVRAGRFIVEPATLLNLGFEWEIAGDANRNATVEVRYREAGGLRGNPRCPYCAWEASVCSARPSTSNTRCPTALPGGAPDLGALEVGRPEPVYGPRQGAGKPFYR
jgi:hypothetical protein